MRLSGPPPYLHPMRIALLLWLILVTLLQIGMGFFLVVAFFMSSMIFTSQEAATDSNTWILIGTVVVAFVVLVILTAAQWVMFALRKHRAAGLLSLVPILVLVFNGPLEKGLIHILRKMDEPDTTILELEAVPSEEPAATFNAE